MPNNLYVFSIFIINSIFVILAIVAIIKLHNKLVLYAMDTKTRYYL